MGADDWKRAADEPAVKPQWPYMTRKQAQKTLNDLYVQGVIPQSEWNERTNRLGYFLAGDASICLPPRR
jgi:hypothetical protein